MTKKSGPSGISIIILNWNTKELTYDCIDSVHKTCADLETEIIVLDNASTDGSQDLLQQLDNIRLIKIDKNVGFAKGNNQAAAVSSYGYILFLNSDTLVFEGALQVMFDLVKNNPKIGLVGAQILNPDDSFQASYTKFPNHLQEFLILSSFGRKIFGRWYPSKGPEEEIRSRMVDYVEGACMLVRKEAFEQVGGFDENYFMYSEEVDLCFSLKQFDWQVWYHPQARILHFGGASSQHRRTQREGDLYRSRVLFFRKHYGKTSAAFLKAQIYIFTALKIGYNGFLSLIKAGNRGRLVISLGELRKKFEGL